MNILTNPVLRKWFIPASIVIVVFLISGFGVYNQEHDKKTTISGAITSKLSSKVDTNKVASDPTSTTPQTKTTATITVATPAPAPTPTKTTGTTPASTTTPITPTMPPVQPTEPIVFSTDGCFATITGTPGWILKGTAGTDLLNGVPQRGGPLGDPDGYVIPASGSTTVEVGTSGYSQANWLLVATLSDQSGNTMSTTSIFIDSTSGAICP